MKKIMCHPQKEKEKSYFFSISKLQGNACKCIITFIFCFDYLIYVVII